MMIHFETNQIDIWQEKMLIPLSIKITAELAGLGVLLCLYSKWESDTRNTTTLTHSYKRALIKKQTHYWKCNYRIRLLSLNLHKNTSGNTFWTKLAPNLLMSDPALCSMRNTVFRILFIFHFVSDILSQYWKSQSLWNDLALSIKLFSITVNSITYTVKVVLLL